jgi:hypothetical protein
MVIHKCCIIPQRVHFGPNWVRKKWERKKQRTAATKKQNFKLCKCQTIAKELFESHKNNPQPITVQKLSKINSLVFALGSQNPPSNNPPCR